VGTEASFVEYVCEQAGLPGLASRKMFGEYALYYDGKVVALACDNQLFLKPTEAGRQLLERTAEGFPYPGAKAHWRLDDEIEQRELLRRLFVATADALPLPKPKPPKAASRRRTP
jgi:TfoX/Sxy family transcriptional regulator of competence genes